MYELPHQSLPEILKLNARRYADRIAISYKKDGEYLSLSYRDFYERVLMAARGLHKAGIQNAAHIFPDHHLPGIQAVGKNRCRVVRAFTTQGRGMLFGSRTDKTLGNSDMAGL